MLSSYNGEKILADVVRRLINQNGWGNPPVKVVLIEPELPQRSPDVVLQATTRYAAVPMCGCNGQ